MHNVGEEADREDEGGGSQVLRAGDQSLVIERLGAHHRISEFCCQAKAKTNRVERFLREHSEKYERSRFANVYVATPKADPGKVFGYYSLSAAGLYHKLVKLSNSQRRLVPGQIDYPMARLGYMGKSDDCQVSGLGEFLVIDAVNRLTDAPLGVWGIILDAELGDPNVPDFKPPDPNTDGLVKWYRERGFASLEDQTPSHTHSMFARLDWLPQPPAP